jgi:thiol:disulfide interchange protein DsbC
MKHLIKPLALLAAAALAAAAAQAGPQEDKIRKNLTDRVPQMGKIDEVTKTPMPGLFEVRVGTDLYYADTEGNWLLHGTLIDTREKRNLTQEREEKLNAIAFDSLPFKDAFTVVRGNGKRKIAVFEDPNCGYCKSFERDLQKVSDVTIYMFLYPILGPDSTVKSNNIWCSKDRAGAWQDQMLRGKAPATASCDTAAVQRNVDFGRKNRITGTPTMIFTDGSRVPGAIAAADVEKLLASKQ